MVHGRHDAVTRLRTAWWVRDQSAQQIFDVLGAKEHRTRAVGGLVRDTILGVTSLGGDIDLATELLPDDVLKLARGAGMSCYPTGYDHGTVTVRNGQVTAEVTTLRQDVVTDGRHARVKFGTNWEVDAKRRDFTMNAIYAGFNGALYDPLDGLGDALSGKVRFIGDPDQRIAEDRLRVFRFFRFTASHGQEQYDKLGLDACARAAGDLHALSAERKGAEMTKILGLPHVVVTLARMTKIGVLAFSIEDLQALLRYEKTTQSPVVAARLALLEGEGVLERLRVAWRLSNALVSETRSIRSAARKMIDGELYDAAYRHGRFAYVAVPVACALANWTKEQCREINEFWEEINVPGFPISGDDLLEAGFSQGPELGKALRRIEQDWVQGGFILQRDELLVRLKKYMAH
ncbi:MAG: CCA tRNA nucleotidyltransferase [Devosiaceae bacterium]|nr:CCA tRNA nucleotidyltransferase [Devosiaceae bacterium]